MSQIKTMVTERMLQLKDLAIISGRVANQSEWCTAIGMKKQNLRQVMMGSQGFTLEQIHEAVTLMDASYDFIFGKISTTNYPKSLRKSQKKA